MDPGRSRDERARRMESVRPAGGRRGGARARHELARRAHGASAGGETASDRRREAAVMRAIAIAALVLAVPLSVRAQECAGGRVATAEGYCCWPGQHWDAANARCDG